MAELCLHLLTKIAAPAGTDPLDRIWSLDHWLASLARVKSITHLGETATSQHFELQFDAGSAGQDSKDPDRVEVARTRRTGAIDVIHLVPPPGLTALKATWWTEPGQADVLFARRTILMPEDRYSPALARRMFGILRENLETLVGADRCAHV